MMPMVRPCGGRTARELVCGAFQAAGDGSPWVAFFNRVSPAAIAKTCATPTTTSMLTKASAPLRRAARNRAQQSAVTTVPSRRR